MQPIKHEDEISPQILPSNSKYSKHKLGFVVAAFHEIWPSDGIMELSCC